MRKKNKQRDNLLRRKREKKNVYRLTKPDHDRAYNRKIVVDRDAVWAKLFSFVRGRFVSKDEVIDRRQKSQRQGDR